MYWFQRGKSHIENGVLSCETFSSDSVLFMSKCAPEVDNNGPDVLYTLKEKNEKSQHNILTKYVDIKM